MNNSSFTLFNLLYDIALDWTEEEKKAKGSIIGNLIKLIENKGKLRDAQIGAIKIYLWLKEKGNAQKLSDLIKNGDLFINDKLIFYSGDNDYKDKPAKRYLNRYLQDTGVKDLDSYLRINVEDEEYLKLIDNLFEDFDYPNYLFSLPMGAGKTFLMAIFIYIDLYMYLKTGDTERYAYNFIVLAPSARKTAILPALKTIKLFNPSWILPDAEAKTLKKLLKIEILDDSAKDDKLQNQNPNLSKINRTINGHEYANVFILNAEKVLPEKVLQEEYELLPKSQKTRIKKAEKIKDALSNLKNIQIFLDEAHHSYSSDNESKKLRTQLDVINKNKNINCCIGMSGTPYVNRKIMFQNKKLITSDIQDIVFYYPLTDAISNFLKTPIIKKVNGDEKLLIKSSLTDFFKNFDITYNNLTKSKIAFYCPSIEDLNERVLPIIYEWYEENGRNKSEILKYYTNSNKNYPLPKENLIHFLNLDNSTSKFRVVLLVAIGTEGWDCKSLTSVVLPRQRSAKNFVLQTTCRCLREAVDASKEKALIYLDKTNYEILDDELNTNYHLHISDINNKIENAKYYPVFKVKKELGTLKYKEVHDNYIEIIKSENNSNDYSDKLKKFSFEKFKEKYPYTNQIGITTISETGLNDSIHYQEISSKINYQYSFTDFLYELEKSTFGMFSCAELIKYKKELMRIHKIITKEENLSWIINHNTVSTYDVCKDITSIFASRVNCQKEVITNEISIDLLNWNLDTKPTIRVTENEKHLTYPGNAYDDIEPGTESYNENLNEIIRRYNDKMKIPNKEKSFNYLPYKMDSTYEFDFIKNALANMDDLNLELYYNGYKNNLLESFKIVTPYGMYTPDFLLIKRNEKNEIIRILLIETKATPYETESKEKFVKNEFVKNNPNYSYIRIGDTTNDINEYNKMVKAIIDFAI